MHKTIAAGLLGAVCLSWSACGAAAAQETAPPQAPAPELLAGPDGPPPPGAPGGDRRFLMLQGPGAGGPPREVIHTLLEIERLYREQGRSKEVVALYQDVLARTRDPMVRHFAYDAIVRSQLQPADTDKALATLKQSLEESLQRLNQMPPPGPGRNDKAAP
ncbi:MAG TPA: hypothetical protein VFA75_07830 [Nevskia sp.]|nr:hypothetical protein [Nevskia sp.]